MTEKNSCNTTVPYKIVIYEYSNHKMHLLWKWDPKRRNVNDVNLIHNRKKYGKLHMRKFHTLNIKTSQCI